MSVITIRSPPSLEDYTLLAEYEAQTPASSTGKPVLHFLVNDAAASVAKSQCGILALFSTDATPVQHASANGQSSSEAAVERKVDVFVTSQNFILFSPDAGIGVAIPYPAIAIHAIKKPSSVEAGSNTESVWMQLEVSGGGVSDEDYGTVELTISAPPNSNDTASSAAQQLFAAISRCSELHPDAEEDGEEHAPGNIIFEGSAEREEIPGLRGVLQGSTDGELPPAMPGSNGWITADNWREHFDDQGNWLPREGTEPVAGDAEQAAFAGRIRVHDEVEPAAVNGNGIGLTDDNQEHKRPRVD